MSANSSQPSTPSVAIDPNTSHPAHKLLAQAHRDDPDEASRIFTDKVLHKPLLLSASTNDDKRAARRHLRLRKKAYALKRARPKPLSAKEKRELRLYELRPEECRYEIYSELNTLWRRYILEVLGYLDRNGGVVKGKVGSGVSASGNAGSLLASADFHGMEVEVVRCSDVGRVGHKGIVVRETRSTLTLVSDEREDPRRLARRARRKKQDTTTTAANQEEQDKVRMILKKGSVFRVTIELPTTEDTDRDPGTREHQNDQLERNQRDVGARRMLIFELHGDQLEIRPIERAVKKFKWRPMNNL